MRLPLAALLLSASTLAAQQPAPTPPPSQPAYAADSGAVVEVITNVFTGMRTRDTALMRAQFHPSATMRSAAYNRTAQPMIEEDGVGDWLTGVAGAPAAMLLDERLGPPQVAVDGNLASLWVYYEFWAGDRFSHCGADAFTLGRTTAGWKILFVADSRRRTVCGQELPVRPPAPPPQPPFSADSAAVLDVARTVLHAMRMGDTATMHRLFEGSVPMRIAGYRNGAPVIGSDSGSSWAHSVAATTPGSLDERIGVPAVQVDGNLAQVWTYYEFRRGTEFSHCGADQFVLGRTERGWKILSLSYSARREGCRQDLAFTPRDRALLDVVAAERAFAHYADTASIGPAFVWALRADAITLDANGVKLMRPIYEARRNNGALLRWAPSWADAAEDGTLGVTTGPWEWRPARDSAVQGRGNFLTIWVKGPERWQVALDIGVGGDSTARLDEPLLEMPGGVTGRGRLEELMGLDRERIRGGGWVRALQALAAPDVRVIREGQVRGAGRDALSGAASVRFTSLGGRVATSGDLGSTWGTWRDGAKKGSYVRIWKRTAEGWRVVIDRMGD